MRLLAKLLCAVGVVTAVTAAQELPVVAPEGSQVQKVWHLGRVTGDLHRIIDFYHDLLGLDLRGNRSPIPFYSVAAINTFVDAPQHAEFRAAFMPIQGTATAVRQQDQIYLEAFEYRNIDRRQVLPPLSSVGVSSLRLIVRDLNKTVAAAKAANVSFITPGDAPLRVSPPAGLSGTARAIMMRDPDGYPVELMEVVPAPETPAPPGSAILGAHMTVIVKDLNASLEFYRRLVGPDLQAGKPGPWLSDGAATRIRNIRDTASRTAAIRLPGSAVVLELMEFKGGSQTPYRPVFQDIGHGHVAFIVKDIEATVDRMKALGARAISTSGTWTQINPTTRAVYTRDPDGFFLEILERR